MTDDKILWLDLETTGVGDDAQILEIGLVVSRGLTEEIATFDAQVLPPGFNPYKLEEVVFNMHHDSGLLRELYRTGLTPSHALNMVWSFVNDHFGVDPITVAGSGVDRFDIPLMHRQHPWNDLAARFNWRTIDISGTKQLLRAAGVEPVPAGKDHRALDDARWAFRVAQQAVGLLEIAAERMQAPAVGAGL